jgi:HAD superfamily hydrolase (TIGR01509 family)
MDEPPLEVVLWDVDGTLIDTTALIVNALDETFRQYTGVSVPPEELRALIGIPVEKQMAYLGDPASFGTTAFEMGETLIRLYERRREQEHPIPEALDALIYFKRQGVRTALVTSKNDEELANTLPRLGISAYCDEIISADRVAPDFKPHPRPVLLALELLGVADPRRAVFIGDSVYDMQSGARAGVRTAAVLWGAATEAMLRAENPDYVIARPDELISTLMRVRRAA